MSRRTLIFVGPSASRSRIHSLCPALSRVLGEDLVVASADMPANQAPTAYTSLLLDVLSRDEVAGGVVTNHKLQFFDAFLQLGFPVSSIGKKLGVVSVFRRVGNRFYGTAEEPYAVLPAIDKICRCRCMDYFREIVIFGAGGAGRAITYAAAAHSSRYGVDRITVTDCDLHRIDGFRHLTCCGNLIDLHVARTHVNDRLLREAARGALVVNATGLGKDASGSPISDHVDFPADSAAWDLNYRGSLDFLRQAKSQPSRCHVSCHDGFDFFLFDWLEILSFIFRLNLAEEKIRVFIQSAEHFRY
jgi:shikimate dehydrogenase